MMDNDPEHTSGRLKRLQLKVLSWSLQSPILNIIVTLNLRSRNLTELKENIPPTRTEGLYRSFTSSDTGC